MVGDRYRLPPYLSVSRRSSTACGSCGSSRTSPGRMSCSPSPRPDGGGAGEEAAIALRAVQLRAPRVGARPSHGDG